MGTLSNWLNQQILLAFFEGVAPTLPSQLYVAVHSTACSASTPGTELTGDGYARTPVSFANVSKIQSWNPNVWSSTTATADWTVASLSIWDDANIGGGNYYAFGNVAETFTHPSTQTLRIPPKKLIIGMGSC